MNYVKLYPKLQRIENTIHTDKKFPKNTNILEKLASSDFDLLLAATNRVNIQKSLHKSSSVTF